MLLNCKWAAFAPKGAWNVISVAVATNIGLPWGQYESFSVTVPEF